MHRNQRWPHLPGAVVILEASVIALVLLGAAEQVRHVRRRFGRTMHRAWQDVEHHERELLLRRALGLLAAELIPVAVEVSQTPGRSGRRAPTASSGSTTA